MDDGVQIDGVGGGWPVGALTTSAVAGWAWEQARGADPARSRPEMVGDDAAVLRGRELGCGRGHEHGRKRVHGTPASCGRRPGGEAERGGEAQKSAARVVVAATSRQWGSGAEVVRLLGGAATSGRHGVLGDGLGPNWARGGPAVGLAGHGGGEAWWSRGVAGGAGWRRHCRLAARQVRRLGRRH